jgi:hypothetical protein
MGLCIESGSSWDRILEYLLVVYARPCVQELFLGFFCARNHKYDSANKSYPAENRRQWNRFVLRLGRLNRSDVQDLLLSGVSNSLIGERNHS